MNGPMAQVIPDVVEQDVTNFWRTLYKLEKGFADVPAAKKLAAWVIHRCCLLAFSFGVLLCLSG